MISIKKNKSLKLDVPKFICDDGINDRLNKYDMLSHFNKYCFTGIIGKPGSGKTSLLIVQKMFSSCCAQNLSNQTHLKTTQKKNV